MTKMILCIAGFALCVSAAFFPGFQWFLVYPGMVASLVGFALVVKEVIDGNRL